jgi:hypothetical protein
LERCKNGSLEKTLQNNPFLQSNDEYGILASKYASLKDEELLQIVTNSKATYKQRYVASFTLRRQIVDAHLLPDLYWWALNTCDDASGEHESILAAELYRSKHGQ